MPSAFLKSTANIVGAALARARAEQALRKSEARLRQLIASTLDAVITAEVSTRDGLSAASVTPDTVMLIRTADQKVIPAAPRIVQTNQIELRPRRALRQ